MVFLNISLFIISAFLILTFLVGIYFSRKKTNFREYAVGNKNFATPTLVAIVLATTFGGGGLVRNVECVHNLGLYWIVLFLLNSLGLWLISRLALRMGSFMHHLSIAETIGSVYGNYPRVISALIIVFSSIIAITGQIHVMDKAISICLTFTKPYVIPIVAAMLLIFYSTFGGIRAVTFTDVLQFLTFSIIIPLLTWFVFKNVGKPAVEVIPILQSQPRFQFSSIFHSNTKLVGMFLFFLSSLLWYINPTIMQRVYMSSRPIQAENSFLYATIFSFIITIFIVLIGLFVFVGSPNLLMTEIWSYIISNVPSHFKGFLAIGLIAMSMSTADSCLNTCSVIMSHDIIKIIQKRKEYSDVYQLRVARATTIVVGIFAMLLTFKFQNLLKIMYLSFDCIIPTITAPFILSIFGFRSSSRTALIGMFTGILAILAWNKWVEPATAINGSFIAMLANGLAMLAAHYLFKQPEGAGWIGPDQEFKQIQQANARKRAQQKEAIKNGWANRKSILSKAIPSHTILVSVGLYSTITSLLAYFIAPVGHHGCRLMLQLVLAACLVGYPFIYDISKKIRAIPDWLVGLCWLMNIALYLPLSLLSHCYHLVAPFFTTSLSLAHCAVILWALPLYMGIGIVATTLLLAIYPIATGLSFAMLCDLLPFFLVTLLIFSIIICLKSNQYRYTNQILYLKDQAKIRTSHEVKSSLYDAALIPSNVMAFPNGSILTQVIAKIEESISFLDSKIPIYKEDFQTIINKLYDWVSYFNRRAKAKNHALLQPTPIDFNKLIRKVEHALSQEVADPPRLLVERIKLPSKEACSDIVCDINQMVYLLVKAILHVAKSKKTTQPVLRIQLQPTALKFKQADAIDSDHSLYIKVEATAFVITHATSDAGDIFKVKKVYNEQETKSQKTPPSIDLQIETMSTIIEAHYGYLELPIHQKQQAILIVLPNDVTQILAKITAKLPIDCLSLETTVTPKEQADSIMKLMQFHDLVCKYSYKDDPIDIGTISGLLLLLRQHFGFRRHASGTLFYVRAVGIAALVVEWVFHSPKVVYAALLYELVRHTCLPISYIKEHYNLGVYLFVRNVVEIDKRQTLDHPSLLYVQNRLREAIKEDHIQLAVLFIKLAERLYDLRHAEGYIYLTEVQHMAQETLTIDVKIANTYLGTEIAKALENEAKRALKVAQDIDIKRKQDS